MLIRLPLHMYWMTVFYPRQCLIKVRQQMNKPVWIHHIENGFKFGISLTLFYHWKIVAKSSQTRLECLMV